MARRRSLKVRALLWIVSFAVLVGIVAGAVAVFAPKGQSTGKTPATAQPPRSTTATGGPTLLADGCLGGSDASQAILRAQAVAQLTPEGAAAFAATYERWWAQLPHKGAVAPVGAKVWTSDLEEGLRHVGEWPAEYAGYTGWGAISATSRYRVDDFDSKSATVATLFDSVQVPPGGGQAKEFLRVARLKLEVVDGLWRFAGLGTAPTVDEMKNTGLPFKGGC